MSDGGGHGRGATTLRRRRRVLFRLAAILFAPAALVVVELILTLFGWGDPRLSEDPFVELESERPLFVLDDSGERYRTSPARTGWFRPDSFRARKPDDEFRIFCLGGSTVQGRPFAIETSFTTWLEIGLRAAAPDRRWEVVNCGGVSYASYRLVPILEEVLRYSPDLVVIYTGHNEFLEDRTYAHVKNLPEAVRAPYGLLARSRLFTLLRTGWLRLTGPPAEPVDEARPVLPEEVNALLDHRGGLEAYHRDEERRRGVVEHFRFNLRRIVESAAAENVEVVLIDPVCNLRDCPPFKSEHRRGLSEEDVARIDELRTSSARMVAGNRYDGRREAVTLIERAISIDSEHAALWFDLGRCREVIGNTAGAREAYRRAKELDVCPLRILDEMRAAIVETGAAFGVPVVDVHALIEARSEKGIPGGDWLIDHVHPSIRGHKLIAAALEDELVRQGIVSRAEGWQERRDTARVAHEQTLDAHYFATGETRLNNLRLWARGRAGLDAVTIGREAMSRDAEGARGTAPRADRPSPRDGRGDDGEARRDASHGADR